MTFRSSFVAALSVAAIVVGSACSIDPLDGAAGSRGPTGSLGTQCSCGNGQPDCDGSQAGCETGLVCARASAGAQQVCTRNCPCPLDFVCQGIGVTGSRALCFPR